MYEHDTEAPDVHYFKSIPWCAQHMRGSNLVVRPPSCRTIQPSGENLLFGRTLNTAGTISALLEIFSNKRAGGDGAAASASATPHNKDDGSSLIGEAKWLLALGQDVNGYPGMLHGGVVAAILDELIGGMVPINRERGLIPAGSYFTAYLHTQYRRPVPTTSGALLGRARFVKVDLARGKVFAEATLEDGEGTVLASAEALFVRARGAKL
ncbi:uncharacterized protein PG986_001013 [Apiospora aurea]|uniref:Thioesterase domain-containing protein n=1 Tax=Apiospora aurea TaxID=335848 RepID=A0ABR1QWN4_9PEZI